MPSNEKLREYERKITEMIRRHRFSDSRSSSLVANLACFFHNPISTLQLANAMRKKSLASDQARVLQLAPELKTDEMALKKITGLIHASKAIQALLGKDINIPQTIIHISILYWLTDEVLDSATYRPRLKEEFANAVKLLINAECTKFEKAKKLKPDKPLELFETLQKKPAIRKRLQLIERHIHAFFKGPFVDRAHEERVMRSVVALNLAQNQCTFVQSVAFYHDMLQKPGADVALPNESDMLAYTKHKGAVTFELYALLLSPTVTDNQLTAMRALGELYQLADDISDIVEDINSKLITPAIMSLMTVKPQHMREEQFKELRESHGLPPNPSSRDICNSFITNFNLLRSGDPPHVDITSFYEHCYHVLAQIQKTFSELKKDLKGLPWRLLDSIEEKMISDIAQGIKSVTNLDIEKQLQHNSSVSAAPSITR